MYSNKRIKNIIFTLLILMVECNSFAEELQSLIPYKLGELYGFMDESLTVVIPAEFDRIGQFSDQYFSEVRWDSNRCGIIDLKGNVIFETSSPQIRHIYNNLYAFDTENGKGIYDLKSKNIILNGLNRVYSSDNGIIAVSFISPVESNYVNQKGEILFPEKNYRRTFSFSEGVAVVIERDWYSYLIDEDGNYVTTKKFNSTSQQFSDGLLFAVDEEENSGFIDTTGKLIINLDLSLTDENPVYSSFKNGIASVKVKDKQSSWILINKKGEKISDEINASYIDQFQEGFARFSIFKNGKNFWNFIDEDGNLLTDNQYEYAESFNHGYAIIYYQGKDALLRNDGEIIFIENILKKK